LLNVVLKMTAINSLLEVGARVLKMLRIRTLVPKMLIRTLRVRMPAKMRVKMPPVKMLVRMLVRMPLDRTLMVRTPVKMLPVRMPVKMPLGKTLAQVLVQEVTNNRPTVGDREDKVATG
jgi:hypothetical protein